MASKGEIAAISPLRRSATMLVLGLSGTSVFLLPFLTELFYEPLRAALGMTNTQIGSLGSAYGIASMLGYVPGGWLADRFAPRLLIAIGLIGTGIGGLVFATFPPYPLAVAIYVLWGAGTVICWGALIRATREWASSSEQGRAFGMLEGVRGLFEALAYSAVVAVFIWLGSSGQALSSVIVQYGAINIALGMVALFALDGHKIVREEAVAGEGAGSSGALRAVLAIPQVWLISVVVLASYTAYYGVIFFAPYGSNILVMSAAVAGAFAAGKVWLKPFAALAAGYLADRIGVWRAVAYCFGVLIACFSLFGFVPGSASLAPLMIANLAVASIAIFALRGIYFALLEECGVPPALTGTTTGLVSVIGFTPDVFAPALFGYLLDAFPGALGYRLFFTFIAVACVIGLAAALATGWTVRRARLAAPIL